METRFATPLSHRREPARRPRGYAARRMDDAGDASGASGADDAALVRIVRFVSVDPAKRRFRFYELRLQATLWGGVALVRVWGRAGTPGRSRVREYPDGAAAGPDVERAVHRRLRRGYRLVEAR